MARNKFDVDETWNPINSKTISLRAGVYIGRHKKKDDFVPAVLRHFRRLLSAGAHAHPAGH